MIYTVVQDPDIISPDELQINEYYASALLSVLDDATQKFVVFNDHYDKLRKKLYANTRAIKEQNTRNRIQKLLESLKRRGRFVERNIICLNESSTLDEIEICFKIFNDHEPDFFIISPKHLRYSKAKDYKTSPKLISLPDYKKSDFCNEVQQRDYNVGKENDYYLLEKTLRFAQIIVMFDRQIGRHWEKEGEYEESLRFLLYLYNQVGEFCKGGEVKVITGFLETTKNEKENKEKYLDMIERFGKKMNNDYPFKFKFIIKREKYGTILEHPRFMRTNQFTIQFDSGFRFFDLNKKGRRQNQISIKDINYDFNSEYEGLDDYTPERGSGKLTYNPFIQLRTKRKNKNVR